MPIYFLCDGYQAFDDDDEDRIVGLDMPWDYARPHPPSQVRRVLQREAIYEWRHTAHILLDHTK